MADIGPGGQVGRWEQLARSRERMASHVFSVHIRPEMLLQPDNRGISTG